MKEVLFKKSGIWPGNQVLARMLSSSRIGEGQEYDPWGCVQVYLKELQSELSPAVIPD